MGLHYIYIFIYIFFLMKELSLLIVGGKLSHIDCTALVVEISQ